MRAAHAPVRLRHAEFFVAGTAAEQCRDMIDRKNRVFCDGVFTDMFEIALHPQWYEIRKLPNLKIYLRNMFRSICMRVLKYDVEYAAHY